MMIFVCKKSHLSFPFNTDVVTKKFRIRSRRADDRWPQSPPFYHPSQHLIIIGPPLPPWTRPASSNPDSFTYFLLRFFRFVQVLSNFPIKVVIFTPPPKEVDQPQIYLKPQTTTTNPSLLCQQLVLRLSWIGLTPRHPDITFIKRERPSAKLEGKCNGDHFKWSPDPLHIVGLFLMSSKR